jgi:N-acyl homoserine lactone hydrolase
LIKADEGNILVDSGMHPEDAEAGFKMKGQPFTWRQEDYLPQQLKSLGLSMGDINMLIMTHLHPDHVGWMKELPNAEIVVQKREYLLNGQPPINRGTIVNRYSNLDKLKWKLIEGDCILMPGITLLYTPGHTVAHQSVMIDLPESGTIILSGDATFLQENFDNEIIPTPFDNAREAFLSIKKLRMMAQLRKAMIIPGHDIEYYRQKVKKSPETYI